jgi:hypothetical protein
VIPPAPSDGETDLAATGRRALGRLRRAARDRDQPLPHPPFDPVKVEAEFYDAIYGARTGTVENIGPVDESRARARPAR